MSIESITNRIKDEASAYADKITGEAKAQAEELLSETRIEADKIKKEAQERAEKDSKTLIERRESVAGLEARKMKLDAKQEVIGESFSAALDKIKSLKDEDYLGFLTNQLKAFADEGGEIQLSADDIKKYGAKLGKEFAGKLTVGKDPANIRGGFLLKQGDISINASIEKLVEDQKEKLTGEVAKLLFPDA